jgi:hypothetical protein
VAVQPTCSDTHTQSLASVSAARWK